MIFLWLPAGILMNRPNAWKCYWLKMKALKTKYNITITQFADSTLLTFGNKMQSDIIVFTPVRPNNADAVM